MRQLFLIPLLFLILGGRPMDKVKEQKKSQIQNLTRIDSAEIVINNIEVHASKVYNEKIIAKNRFNKASK